MYKTKKRTGKGLKILLVITFIFLALFIASFVIFAFVGGQSNDPALKDFAEVIKYHVEGFKDLFTFKFHETSNIIYFGLSSLLYGLIALWVIFLIVGIAVGKKNRRGIVAFGIILMLLSVASYLFTAAGTPKYWLIINRRDYFENTTLLLVNTFVLLAAALLFGLSSLISYFACILEAFKNPKVEVKETAENEDEEEEEKEEEKPETEPVVEEPTSSDEVVVFEAFEAEPETEAESAPEEEPIPEPTPTPILEEPAEEEEYAEEEKETPKEESLNKQDLANLIRDIVREEISRNNPPAPQQTFAGPGPLIVQYFGTNPVMPQQPVEEPKPAPQSEPKKEEEKPAPQPAPQPELEEVPEEPAPEPEPEPVPEPTPEPEVEPQPEPEPEPVPVEEPVPEIKEKKPIIRIPFQVRMINADEEMKKNYNELKNEILSYGVNSRVSNSGDAFRLHRKTYVKITIAGLSLKLYFALNPDDYKDSPLPVQNAGHKGIYAEIPLVFKVKSGLSMRRAKELIQTVMEKDGFEQGVIEDIDWVEKLKEEPVDDSSDEGESKED